MIRLVHAVRRSANLTVPEFLEWWTNEHAPLVAWQQSRLGIGRYVVSYRLTDPLSEGAMDAYAEARGANLEPPYDGLAECWWPSEAALRVAMETDAWQRANAELIAHESEAIDLPSSPIWLAHEYPQTSTVLGHVVARPQSGIVKHTFPMRSPLGMAIVDAQRHWHWEHGPLVRSRSQARASIRYQQVHRYESELESAFTEPRQCVVEGYFGHGEAWFDRLVSRSGPEVDEAARHALDDEVNFIDWSRSTIWVNKEIVVVDRW